MMKLLNVWDKNTQDKKALLTHDAEYHNVKKELDDLLLLLNCLRRKFDVVTEEEDVKVCVYEMEAMETRINFCIKRAKALKLEAAQAQVSMPAIGEMVSATL